MSLTELTQVGGSTAADIEAEIRSKVHYFGSVSAMSAYTGESILNGAVAKTVGYFNFAVGGSASYTYDSASTATVDGFLVHNSALGGRWLLNKDNDRFAIQVAGAKVDGVTDDRQALLAFLASDLKIALDYKTTISGSAIDLSQFSTVQSLGLDIEGSDPNRSIIEFTSGSGGFFASSFFRGFTATNLTIRNATMDKTGVAFINTPGAEMIAWKNVSFTGWRMGGAVHAWNATLDNVTHRSCYFAGAYYGTSMKVGSLYAVGCDYSHSLGVAYSGGLTGNLQLPPGGLALSYASFSALASDSSGPYTFGRCFNLEIASMGAERCTSAYIVDLSIFSVATARQMVTINSMDVYVQTGEAPIAVFGPVANAYGALFIDNAHIYSDKNIPLLSGDGKGIKLGRNALYNSSSTKPMTANVTNGVAIGEELIIGSDYNQLKRVGYTVAGYDQVRKIKALVPMVLSATSKVVIPIQDENITGRAQGVFVSGTANFYPVHKGGNNSGLQCGQAIFSVAGDSIGALSSINLQKLGSLSTVTATYRLTGTVHELVLTVPSAAVQYLCELEFWCNGKSGSSNINYYTEA